MTPKQFYYDRPKPEVTAVAESAGTTFANFKQIAIAGGSVGTRLAERLARASCHQMTEMEILYPERYEDSEDQRQAS